MITERQKAFRREYRSRIVGWYDGYVHILIITRSALRRFTFMSNTSATWPGLNG